MSSGSSNGGDSDRGEWALVAPEKLPAMVASMKRLLITAIRDDKIARAICRFAFNFTVHGDLVPALWFMCKRLRAKPMRALLEVVESRLAVAATNHFPRNGSDYQSLGRFLHELLAFTVGRNDDVVTRLCLGEGVESLIVSDEGKLVECVRVLLEFRADPNTGIAPCDASEGWSDDSSHFMAGIIHMPMPVGFTPLMLAASQGLPRVCSELLDASMYSAPLAVVAASSSRLQLFCANELLLSAGVEDPCERADSTDLLADPCARLDLRCRIQLGLAPLPLRVLEAMRVILERGAGTNASFSLSVVECGPDNVWWQATPNLYLPCVPNGQYKTTPLHFAMLAGDLEAAELLLQHKAVGEPWQLIGATMAGNWLFTDDSNNGDYDSDNEGAAPVAALQCSEQGYQAAPTKVFGAPISQRRYRATQRAAANFEANTSYTLNCARSKAAAAEQSAVQIPELVKALQAQLSPTASERVAAVEAAIQRQRLITCQALPAPDDSASLLVVFTNFAGETLAELRCAQSINMSDLREALAERLEEPKQKLCLLDVQGSRPLGDDEPVMAILV